MPVTITKEMVIQAITHAHDECGEGGDVDCIHAAGMTGAMTELVDDLIMLGYSPLSTYAHALHVGYKLHQLVQTKEQESIVPCPPTIQ